MSKFCIIIPIYNHAQFLTQLVAAIEPFGVNTIFINDGSSDHCSEMLAQLVVEKPFISSFSHSQNLGKGQAVKTGLLAAQKAGFTHAIQLDADCQHDFNDIPLFIIESQKHPNALICGYPIYDSSVPKLRLYFRYITHFWVSLNTLSRQIKDAMCGFRCYPVDSSIEVFEKYKIGNHMEFDIDIIVRLFWHGIKVINIPTKVIYHDDNSSHFNTVKDNIAISKTHAKLFFIMLNQSIKLFLKRLL